MSDANRQDSLPPGRNPGGSLHIAKAQPEDAPAIQAMVQAAYSKYTERIGTPPAPMLQDYVELITSGSSNGQEVYVMRADNDAASVVVGSIIIGPDNDDTSALRVNNVVVDPAAQTRGYGRRLMGMAEELGQARGLGAVTLYTNVKMSENLVWYARLGFEETGRRVEGPYERVYFRKSLG